MTTSDYRTRPDRTVHAVLAGGSEIVRYGISGKWYREGKYTRWHLTVGEAAERVISDDWPEMFWGREGGAVFDRLVRAAMP
jgi:hypothetical protein